MAVLLEGEGYIAKAWNEVGRTDTVVNSLSAPRAVTERSCAGICCVATCCAGTCVAACMQMGHACVAQHMERRPCRVAQEDHGPLTASSRTLPVPATRADPEFRKPLRASYKFEQLQRMRLAVYDVDVRERDNRKLRLEEQVDSVGQGAVAGGAPS